jgi:predicted nucleotidyltransferase component of viral defense system
MKDYLAQLVRAAVSPAEGLNVAREYLQARILGALQRAGAMVPLAFYGGTALRFLYASARYSEDLDFALEGGAISYDLRAYLHAVRRELEAEGYPVELRVNEQRTVHNAWVRFRGLPYELGLSPHRDRILAVKIEVDSRPPAGAGLATTVIRRYVTLQLQHHDRASLLAGKLHAILQRPYVKGRDVYDLLWYLSDPGWPAPNLVLLNNALQQTGWEHGPLAEDTWREAVRARLLDVSWDAIRSDVQAFLERSTSIDLLNYENLMQVLTG